MSRLRPARRATRSPAALRSGLPAGSRSSSGTLNVVVSPRTASRSAGRDAARGFASTGRRRRWLPQGASAKQSSRGALRCKDSIINKPWFARTLVGEPRSVKLSWTGQPHPDNPDVVGGAVTLEDRWNHTPHRGVLHFHT